MRMQAVVAQLLHKEYKNTKLLYSQKRFGKKFDYLNADPLTRSQHFGMFVATENRV